MPSNALSQKSFSTKTPVICKPPPWPPQIIPPPLPKAIFWCFATFKHDGWPGVPQFAASCTLYYKPAWQYWVGSSHTNSDSPWIAATIRSLTSLPKYYIRIVFHWPPTGGTFFEWSDQQFSVDRPYVGQTLKKFMPYHSQRATVTAREKPP